MIICLDEFLYNHLEDASCPLISWTFHVPLQVPRHSNLASTKLPVVHSRARHGIGATDGTGATDGIGATDGTGATWATGAATGGLLTNKKDWYHLWSGKKQPAKWFSAENLIPLIPEKPQHCNSNFPSHCITKLSLLPPAHLCPRLFGRTGVLGSWMILMVCDLPPPAPKRAYAFLRKLCDHDPKWPQTILYKVVYFNVRFARCYHTFCSFPSFGCWARNSATSQTLSWFTPTDGRRASGPSLCTSRLEWYMPRWHESGDGVMRWCRQYWGMMK